MKNKIKYIVLDIETTGLNPIDNQVTCICMKNQDGYTYVGYDGGKKSFTEQQLIMEAVEWIYESKPDIIITKNGKQFDIPFMTVRNTNIGNTLLNIKHIDLQEITQGRVKLVDMAYLMGLKINKSGYGKDAIMLFKEKKFEELIRYCKQDVEVTEQVYLKWLKLSEKVKK